MTLRERFPFVMAHKLPLSLLACGVAFILWQIAGGIIFGVESGRTDRKAAHAEAQSQAAVQAAAQSEQAADAQEVNRQVEDRVRASTITPNVERAGQRVKEAQTNYEAAQKNYRSPDARGLALHERNCTDLKALYPGRQFDFCR